MNRMKKCVGVWGLCCLLLLTALLSGCTYAHVPDEGAEGGGHYCGPTELMWNGEIYHSTGIGRYEYLPGGEMVAYGNSPGTAYLPEGFAQHGPSTEVDRRPQADGETFGVGEGIIYTNPDAPETVYIRAVVVSPTYHTETSHYIRFVSDALWNGENLIRWNGSDYRMTEEVLDVLPDGCTELGRLCFVGRDTLPKLDLETNSLTYGEGRLTDGRKVYEGDGKLYVQITVWRSGSEQTAYKIWAK